jgi:hypothetical protein
MIHFQLTENIGVEDELAPLARAAGMRIVAESGYAPISVNMIPDHAHRGEVKWVNPHHIGELEDALKADPAQAPVVLLVSDLAKLIGFARRAANTLAAERSVLGATAEELDALDAAEKAMA